MHNYTRFRAIIYDHILIDGAFSKQRSPTSKYLQVSNILYYIGNVT